MGQGFYSADTYLLSYLSRHALLDPKLAVESISEVPGASKAHLEVVGLLNGAVP
jgi:hypothetical protein